MFNTFNIFRILQFVGELYCSLSGYSRPYTSSKHSPEIVGGNNNLESLFVCFWPNSSPVGQGSPFTKFIIHTQRRNTVVRTPLDEWSARRREFYLTTHKTHNRKHSCPDGIRTHKLSRRAAAELRLRSRDHWDRLFKKVSSENISSVNISISNVYFAYHHV